MRSIVSERCLRTCKQTENAKHWDMSDSWATSQIDHIASKHTTSDWIVCRALELEVVQSILHNTADANSRVIGELGRRLWNIV